MNLPIDQYPTEGTTNENVLFSTLGAFWTQVFNDKAALKGMSLAQAEGVCQSYYDLIAAVDSYSAARVSIFQKVKWFPIFLKLSDLNTNVLKFGEGAKFGEDYVFGRAPAPENNVYVTRLPEGLNEISVITNRVISPDFVLVNNLDVQIKSEYLHFYGNPFLLKNISVVDLVSDSGTPVYFNDPLTGQEIPDKVMVLWVYNCKIASDSLNHNVAYLFGLNITPTEESKKILEAVVKLTTNPSVARLKALCAAFLGFKPVLDEVEEVVSVQTTSTDHMVITDKHVYRFDTFYTLNPKVVVGSKVYAGDIMTNAVEFYDTVVYKDWWLNQMAPRIAVQTNAAIKSPAYTLAPHMFAGNCKFGLTFRNSMELVSRSSTGYISFPIEGEPEDTQAFNDYINHPDNITQVLAALGGLANNELKLVNPMDFLFKNVFEKNSAMIKINFKTLKQLDLFTQFFQVFKKSLPAHVYFLFFLDIAVPNDVYTSDLIVDGSEDGTTMPSVPAGYASRNYNDLGDGWVNLDNGSMDSDIEDVIGSSTGWTFLGAGTHSVFFRTKGNIPAGTQIDSVSFDLECVLLGADSTVVVTVATEDESVLSEESFVLNSGNNNPTLTMGLGTFTVASNSWIYVSIVHTSAGAAETGVSVYNMTVNPNPVIDTTAPVDEQDIITSYQVTPQPGANVTLHKQSRKVSDGVGANTLFSPSNLFVQDRILVKAIPSGVTSRDYNFIDLTKDPSP